MTERETIQIDLSEGKKAFIDMPRFVSAIDLQMLINGVYEARQKIVNELFPLSTKDILRLQRRFDKWCSCIVRDERETGYFTICNICDKRCKKR